MMENFFRLNSRFLIPTDEKDREIFVKLKKGDKINARVIEYNNGKALLSIKGTEVLSNVNRELIRGELVKLQVDGYDGESILMSVLDEGEESAEQSKDNIQPRIMSAVMKEGALLKKENIENIIKNYKQITTEDKEILNLPEKQVFKTLIFLEKFELKANKEIFESLFAFFNKEVDEKIKIDDNLKEKLKKAVKESKKGKTKFSKGTTILNRLNKLQGNPVLEYIIGLEGQKLPMEMKIYQEEEEESGGGKKNSTVSIKLNLSKLGEIEVKIRKTDKNIDIIFVVDDRIDKKNILGNIGKLQENLEAKGLHLASANVRHRYHQEEVKYQGVNIKI